MRQMNLEMIQWLDIHDDMEPDKRKLHLDFEKSFSLSRDEADIMIHAWQRIEDHRDWKNVDFSSERDIGFDWGRPLSQ